MSLKLAEENLEHQWIFTGLYHSNPAQSQHPIANTIGKCQAEITPFKVLRKTQVIHLPEVSIQGTDVLINGVLVLVENENLVDFEYIVKSTDQKSKCNSLRSKNR